MQPSEQPHPPGPAERQAADATLMLGRIASGDHSAAKELLPVVYAQLRAAAARAMAFERRDHTLQPTALVHEAYLKLLGPRETPWAHRAHFYVAAAEAMRQILLDHARARGRIKRGGGRALVRLDDTATLAATPPAATGGDSSQDPYDDSVDVIALDDAMRRLEVKDPRLAQVVRLKYYAGLEIAQVALALGISERTVKNDWAFAKAWLERTLRQSDDRKEDTP